jgi:sugar phosphate isomerase/epimerase
MVLGVSNLAWEIKETSQVLKKLQKLGITSIEGVPSKIADWDKLDANAVKQFKQKLTNNNINIPSMQSIFYGIECSDISEVEVILEHFNRVIEYSKILGTHILVFGSPQLRKKIKDWDIILNQIFTRLDDMLDNTGITVVIEPNAKIYKGEFFNTVEEIVLFIEHNKLRNISTMIDTHNILLENQDPLVVFPKYFTYIKHIHVSEVGLNQLIDQQFHKNFSKAIFHSNYTGMITYELLPCKKLINELITFLKIYKN